MQQLITIVRRIQKDVWIRRVEFQIRDHRKELILEPLDHHELPSLDILDTPLRIELHVETLHERPLRDHPQRIPCRREFELFAVSLTHL